MMLAQGLLGQLIKSLSCLPGVGPKSAQRMAFYLIQRDKTAAMNLAQTLIKAVQEIGHCERCRTLTEKTVCDICSHPERDASLLCIVENPSDVWVINQATIFNGLFFVLHGRLSPLDGIGPSELGMDLLENRFATGNISEVVLATNPTLEGEATALFIAELAQSYQVKASRIAHGIPMGGELEYIDRGTLSHAFNGRRAMS